MSEGLRAIRVRCQKPGCQERTTLELRHLEEIGRRAGVVLDPGAGMVASFMVMIGGWGYSVDDRGVLYAVCPGDGAAIRLSPEANG